MKSGQRLRLNLTTYSDPMSLCNLQGLFYVRIRTMIDITLLGTGGTVPLPDRFLTSLLIRWMGHEMLIDCGEGTQIALNEHGLSCRHIDAIFLTHFHADHTAGLPGLLLSMAKADRTEPITVYGPKGLNEIMEGVRLIARYIPFEVDMVEVDRDSEIIQDELHIHPVPLRHSVPCFGYVMNMPRKPKFDRERAVETGIPMKYWGTLQKGNIVEEEGHTYTPDMVLGKNRKGLKIVYATDTRPVRALQEEAKCADLLITEGMYGDPEKIEKARLNRHMMMQEACNIAKKADVKQLWLTHYSPSMHVPSDYEEECRSLFEHTVISVDGQHVDLSFQDEDKK